MQKVGELSVSWANVSAILGFGFPYFSTPKLGETLDSWRERFTQKIETDTWIPTAAEISQWSKLTRITFHEIRVGLIHRDPAIMALL